eukprot:m.321471 g.321471  ORF g.321471 m.321471 type:complete len:67 (+) comp16529_c1_seq4:1084-1284(+)
MRARHLSIKSGSQSKIELSASDTYRLQVTRYKHKRQKSKQQTHKNNNKGFTEFGPLMCILGQSLVQ